MKSLLILFLAFTLLILPCSAENVTIEILQNSAGDYFIDYEGDLIPCMNDTCKFDIANFSVNNTEIELTKDDMKKIAQYVALEIEIPEYTGGINETFLTKSLVAATNQMVDSTSSRISTAFVPNVEEINAVKVNLTAAQSMISGLKAEAKLHDKVIATYELDKSIRDKYIETLELAGIVLTIGLIFVIMTCTKAGKEFLVNIRDIRRKE